MSILALKLSTIFHANLNYAFKDMGYMEEKITDKKNWKSFQTA